MKQITLSDCTANVIAELRSNKEVYADTISDIAEAFGQMTYIIGGWQSPIKPDFQPILDCLEAYREMIEGAVSLK